MNQQQSHLRLYDGRFLPLLSLNGPEQFHHIELEILFSRAVFLLHSGSHLARQILEVIDQTGVARKHDDVLGHSEDRRVEQMLTPLRKDEMTRTRNQVFGINNDSVCDGLFREGFDKIDLELVKDVGEMR